MDHIERTGERQLESLLEQVDERCQQFDARAERTQQQVESGTQAADWPSADYQQQQPYDGPTDSAGVSHLCAQYDRQDLHDMIGLHNLHRGLRLIVNSFRYRLVY